MKGTIPINSIATIYKRSRCLKKMIAPLCILALSIHLKVVSVVVEVAMCKDFLVCSNMFTYTVTKKKYFIKGELNCNTNNIIYLTFCKLYS